MKEEQKSERDEPKTDECSDAETEQTGEGDAALMDTWQGAEQLFHRLSADINDFLSWPRGLSADSLQLMAFIYNPSMQVHGGDDGMFEQSELKVRGSRPSTLHRCRLKDKILLF